MKAIIKTLFYSSDCNEQHLAHENLRQFRKATISSDKSFCLIFSFFFVLIGLYPLLHSNPVRAWSFGISIVLFILAFIKPSIIQSLNRTWVGIGTILGKITTPIVMGILYFSIFSLIAIVAKTLRKDFLRLNLSTTSKSETYWITRKNETLPKRNFSTPF